jgi:hypothetical protein
MLVTIIILLLAGTLCWLLLSPKPLRIEEQPLQEPLNKTLDETVTVPKEQQTLKPFINVRGVTYEVHTSEKGSMYYVRYRTRDNRPYKIYLNEEQKEEIVFK